MAKAVKANPVEKMLVQKRLKVKYSSMSQPGWGKSLTPNRTSQISSQLKKAGLGESDIARLRGKKK